MFFLTVCVRCFVGFRESFAATRSTIPFFKLKVAFPSPAPVWNSPPFLFFVAIHAID